MRSPIGLALAAAVAIGATGCSSDELTGLNRNPNSPVEATPDYLLANGIEASVSRVFGSGLHMDITGLWVQHFAEHRFSTEDRYTLSDASVSGHWSSFYAGPLQDFQETIGLAVEGERPNAMAQGLIMRTWTYQVVTDLWGDVGYTEALRGREPGSGNTPAFDPQQQVYTGMLTDLRTAHDAIVAGGREVTTGDILYGGNTDRWKRFANSLQLRLAMRLSGVAEETARAKFQEALTAGVFTGNADNAVLRYIEGGNNVSPIFAYERSRDDHSVSATIIDTLKSLSDPRLPVYAKPTASGTYVGMKNGSTTQPALTAISKIGAYFADADAPALLMTYAEVLFLQAEAAERGWITADAATLYRDAIRASMELMGVTKANIDAYLEQPRVQYQGGAEGLRQIGLQKWLALYGNSVEAYAEWRRTGFPALTAGPDALNDKRIPVRLPYPAREQSLNGANLEAAIERQGGASLNDPVWWGRK
ncbi:MAG TPA: SusD/RagB family nutrient-binding outer membrane lipoprotein [Gemmatimonadales bacterium]